MVVSERQHWLACAASDVSAILVEGYKARRRKYIPLAACPEDAICAFWRYKPDASPELLLVTVPDSKIKIRGKGYSMHVCHWPGKHFKTVPLVDALMGRIQEISTEATTATETRRAELEEMMDELREENKRLENESEELKEENLRLHARQAKLEKKLEDVLEDVEETVAGKFSEHFEDLPEELLSTTVLDDELWSSPTSWGMERAVRKTPLEYFYDLKGGDFLVPPELHEKNDIIDITTKFIKKEHDVRLRVVGVWKIDNDDLEDKFQQFCGDYSITEANIKLKFHGTRLESAAAIIKNGFKLPDKQGAYGKGIYFASDSTKSVRYSKGSVSFLLVCAVALGKVKEQRGRDPTLNFATLEKLGYDSVYAPRNTKGTGGVFNDEYIVYDERQVVPRFVVLVEAAQDVAEKTKHRISSTLWGKAHYVMEGVLSSIRDSVKSILAE